MLELVPRIRQAWDENRTTLLASATSIREHLERLESADLGGRSLGADALRQGFSELAASFDREHAGFGSAP